MCISDYFTSEQREKIVQACDTVSINASDLNFSVERHSGNRNDAGFALYREGLISLSYAGPITHVQKTYQILDGNDHMEEIISDIKSGFFHKSPIE